MQAPISDIPPGGLLPSSRAVWLPPGIWSRWGGNGSVSGPVIDATSYGVAEIPLFVRAGALLPLAARGDEERSSPDLVWTLWLDGDSPVNGSASVYEDDGASAAYQKEAGARTNASYSFSVTGSKLLELTVFPTAGDYAGMPAIRAHSLQVRAPPALPMTVCVDGSAVPRIPPGSGGPGWWVSTGTESLLTEPTGAVVVSAGKPIPMVAGVNFTIRF